jgi:hypothetical protein
MSLLSVADMYVLKIHFYNILSRIPPRDLLLYIFFIIIYSSIVNRMVERFQV